jgi:hypothetical protein
MTYSTMTPNINTSPPPPETLTLENLRPTLPIGKTTSRCPRGVGASELRKTGGSVDWTSKTKKKRERIRMERKKRRVGWFLLLVNDQD